MEQQTIDAAIKAYNVTDAAISEISQEALALKTNGPEDKEASTEVRSMRIKIKKILSQVEKTRVEQKADALKFGQIVDGEAKRIKGGFKPAYAHLQAEEKKVADEIERRKQEALVARCESLDVITGCAYSPLLVSAMDEEEFESFLTAQVELGQERERLAEEEAARVAAERDKRKAQEAEREAAQAREWALFKEERERLEAEKKAEAERATKERAAFEEEKRKADEEARIQRAELDRKRTEVEAKERKIAEAKRIEEEAARLEQEKQGRLDRKKIAAENRAANEEADRVNERRRDAQALTQLCRFMKAGNAVSITAEAILTIRDRLKGGEDVWA